MEQLRERRKHQKDRKGKAENRKYILEHAEEIYNAFLKGMTYDRICEKFGITEYAITVSRYLMDDDYKITKSLEKTIKKVYGAHKSAIRRRINKTIALTGESKPYRRPQYHSPSREVTRQHIQSVFGNMDAIATDYKYRAFTMMDLRKKYHLTEYFIEGALFLHGDIKVSEQRAGYYSRWRKPLPLGQQTKPLLPNGHAKPVAEEVKDSSNSEIHTICNQLTIRNWPKDEIQDVLRIGSRGKTEGWMNSDAQGIRIAIAAIEQVCRKTTATARLRVETTQITKLNQKIEQLQTANPFDEKLKEENAKLIDENTKLKLEKAKSKIDYDMLFKELERALPYEKMYHDLQKDVDENAAAREKADALLAQKETPTS